MSRARVGAYALWQLRDYFKDRGLSTLIIAVLSAYLAMSTTTETVPMPLPSDPVVPGMLARFGNPDAVYAARMSEFSFHLMRSMLGAMIFLGALFAMNGIVANDRKQGFFRFLFAKPAYATNMSPTTSTKCGVSTGQMIAPYSRPSSSVTTMNPNQCTTNACP